MRGRGPRRYAPAVRVKPPESRPQALVETFFDGSAEQVVAAVSAAKAVQLRTKSSSGQRLIEKARKDGSR